MKKTNTKKTSMKNIFMETVHSAEFMVVLVAMTIASTFALTVSTSTDSVFVGNATEKTKNAVAQEAHKQAAINQSTETLMGEAGLDSVINYIDNATLPTSIETACNNLRTKAETHGIPDNLEILSNGSMEFIYGGVTTDGLYNIIESEVGSNDILAIHSLCNAIKGENTTITITTTDPNGNDSTDSTAGGSAGSSDGSGTEGGIDGNGGF